MPSNQEKIQPRRQDQESLIFKTPDQASEFTERVAEKARYTSGEGVSREREVLAEEVAAELAKYNEYTTSDLSQPWEHSKEEHIETQALVDKAFAEDLATALKRARKSQYYPRIIDLFHDVLTSQMYESILKNRLNKPRPNKGIWILVALIAFFLTLALLVLFVQF